MSTVLADSRSGTMYADKQMSIHSASVTKIFKTEKADGVWLIGGAGNLTQLHDLVHWFSGPADARAPTFDPDRGGIQAVVMGPDRQLWLYWNDTTPLPVEEPYIAVGSGSEYAMGALDAGASPKRAMSIAARRDPNTNSALDVLKLPKESS